MMHPVLAMVKRMGARIRNKPGFGQIQPPRRQFSGNSTWASGDGLRRPHHNALLNRRNFQFIGVSGLTHSRRPLEERKDMLKELVDAVRERVAAEDELAAAGTDFCPLLG